MIALLVMFTGIGLAGLLMLLAGTQLQASRVAALERKAAATMMQAEAMLAGGDHSSNTRQRTGLRPRDRDEA